MQPTAVALLDALGYKRIWQRARPEDVLLSLESIVSAGEKTSITSHASLSRRIVEGHPLTDYLSVNLWLKAFSDTIIVACSPSVTDRCPAHRRSAVEALSPSIALLVVSEAVAAITAAAAFAKVPLAYRGAISFGDLASSDRFLVGPAIDEASTMERQSEGAFIVLCPSAHEIADQRPSRFPLVRNYPTPTKTGMRRYHLINPTCYTIDPDAYTQAIVATFTGDDTVTQKREHTREFLSVAACDPDGVRNRAAFKESLRTKLEAYFRSHGSRGA